MSNKCNCADLPEVFGLDDVAAAFAHLDMFGEKDDGVRTIHRCRGCGQHWQLDDWDIINIRLAIRIDNPQEWINFDDKPIRMTFLVNSRGGLSNEECTWPGCKTSAVSGLTYCAFHAVEF